MTLVVAITHFFLRRSNFGWSSFGVGDAGRWRAALLGLVGGTLLAAGWLAIIAWFSPFELSWNGGWTAAHLVAASIGTVAMGIAEEVGYRTFGLFELRRVAGYGVAVAVSTVIFIASHIAGGVPWQAALLVVGSASILFCILMLETRSLPLVVALHVTTNLVQDNTVRGTDDASLLTVSVASSPAAGVDLHLWTAIGALNLLVAAGMLARRLRRAAARP